MFDWTAHTKDPTDKKIGRAFQAFLSSLCSFYTVPRNDFLRDYFRGARVLDIGAGEHDPSCYNEDKWEHGIISKVAISAMGIDINPDVCAHYNNKGFHFTCVDATSDADLGQRFDLVFMGDVIEHVNNPVALLKFATRHLAGSGGRILLSTPNPFCLSFLTARLKSLHRPFFMANFEHMSWIAPTNANEIARRAGLQFTKIYFPKPKPTSWRHIKMRALQALGLSELAHKEYMYEFTAP